MADLAGQRVLITGAGRGIGRAMALANAAAGAAVIVAARTSAEIEDTARLVETAGGTAKAIRIDVLDLAAVETAVAGIERDDGPIDAVINNHGVFGAIGPIWEVDPASWWTDVEVSVRGTFNMCRAVLPHMRERRRGRIVNLVGGGTAGALPMGSGYAAAKSGVARMTECIAATVADDGIVVIAMAPGLVRTAMTEWQLSSPEGKKYMAGIAKRFADGDDLPAERAGELTVAIASGRFDALSGRCVSAWDDFDKVEAAAGGIVARDRRVLRMPGLGPTMKPTDT